MVLATKVGRARRFWAGFGLAVATFSVYSYYWDFKTQDELHKQFELARENRDQGAVWYIMGFVLPVLRFVYFAYYVGNLRYLRARFGFQRSMSVGHFLGLAIPGTVAFFLGLLVGLALVSGGLGTDAAGNVVVTNAGELRLGLAIAAVGLGLYILLYALAYARLQREVNEVWSAYDARAAAIRSGQAAVQPAGWLAAGPATVPPRGAAPAPGPSDAPPAGPAWRPPPRP